MCENNLSSRAESAEVNASVVCCLQPNVKLLIDGNFQDSKADKWVNVTNPVRGQSSKQISVPVSNASVASAPLRHPTGMPCTTLPAIKSHWAVCNRYA
jgi:hypothetical protein